MKNRIISLLICATVLTSTIMMPASVYAEPTDEAATEENADETAKAQNINAEGESAYMTTGTQQNAMDLEEDVDADLEEELEELIPAEIETISISSAEEFIAFSRNCRLDTWSANKNVELTKDILLAGTDFTTIPYFAGTFNGNGHTISGYLVGDEEPNIALFSKVAEGAVIENLKLIANVIPTGKVSVIGGIAARNGGYIKNCSFKGIVTGQDYIGGIVAINELRGIVADCTSEGFIAGVHTTGGIAGENMGNILRCTNNASVNIREQNVSKSIEDINLDYYRTLFSITNAEDRDSDKESMANGVVDTGGIAGLSIGVIQHCTNNGMIGYEKIGYNVGGIAGRQSGYINDCTNTATILGRKDVGGIVGQAEPYVTIDFSQDIVAQLSDNISKLHDIIEVTLQDTDKQSDIISNRLSVIKSFTDSALDDTGYLADNTVSFVDGVMDQANEASSRVDFLIDEMAKDDGVLDQMKYASENISNIGNALVDTVEDFSIKEYLTADEQKRLDNDLKSSKDGTDAYSKLMKDAKNAFTQYYRDKLRAQDKYWTTGYEDPATHIKYTEQHMFPTINGVNNTGWPKYTSEKDTWDDDKIYEEYKDLSAWHHMDGDRIIADYPAPKESPQGVLDAKLEEDLDSKYAAFIATRAAAVANKKFEEIYGTSPQDYLEVSIIDATELIYKAIDKMGDQVPEDAERAQYFVDNLSSNLKSAFSQTKDTFRTIGDKDAIKLPKLGEEYRAHCTSLNNSLQGMSDNFGYLNSEMNNGSHEMVDDLSAVNDQFNVIMELYADAIDGVLDKDYSTVIQDDSRLVAEECVDATIADCINYGDVDASIDVAGIAGTMAIEYDYDLESDVTGIKDSNMNTTYLTKCVLRQNTNRGRIKSQKDYSGGICGLQEMGIILKCGNYAKVSSDSGDYVGGVAGSSLSDILASYEKSLIEGRTYVGGIVGKGYNISDCFAIPNIEEPTSFYGAIAGSVSDSGVVRDNYFVNDMYAGIDRVSYKKKAEPVSYEEIINMDGVPEDFRNLKILYLITEEDENGDEVERTLASNMYKYGSAISTEDYPLVPYKDGFYSKWDIENVDFLTTDMEITAEYVRLVSTLASDTYLANGQSQVLVDGHFMENDSLVANINNSGALPESVEGWELVIPDDGKLTHTVRYHLPDSVAEQIGDDFAVYVYEGSKWTKVSTEKMGAYTLFEVGGSNPRFQIVNEHKEIPMIYIFIAAGVALAVIIIVVLLVVTKKKKSKKLNAKIK